MKFSIERNHLVEALSIVSSIVDSRNTIPILSHVKLEAHEDGITFATTNLDMGMIEKKPAEVSEKGATTVSAQNLLNLVKKFRNDDTIDLEIGQDKNTLNVSNGKKTRYKFPTLTAKDFVPVTVEGDTNDFEIHSTDLLRLLNKVRFAISFEETRYYLNGVYFHVCSEGDKKKFRAVTTDGHRLSCVDTDVPETCKDFDEGVIIPRQAIAVLDKLVAGIDDTVYFSATKNMISMRVNQTSITSKLIDGKFPDYNRVIPTDNTIKLTMNNAVFKDVVDRVQVMSEERSRSVKLSIADNKAVLSVEGQTLGSGSEEIEAEYEADAMDIGFNAIYLLDIIKLIEDDDIQIMLLDSNSPALVLDPADPDSRYVVMPLRV